MSIVTKPVNLPFSLLYIPCRISVLPSRSHRQHRRENRTGVNPETKEIRRRKQPVSREGERGWQADKKNRGREENYLASNPHPSWGGSIKEKRKPGTSQSTKTASQDEAAVANLFARASILAFSAGSTAALGGRPPFCAPPPPLPPLPPPPPPCFRPP